MNIVSGSKFDHSLKRRTVDVLAAGFGLGVLAFVTPVALTGAVVFGAGFKPRQTLQALKFVAAGNPFFLQKRYGAGDTVFTMVKLRSMTNQRTLDGALADVAQRRHWFGDFMRRYSIDELPQLWNVLRGDMTLVGPRPMMVEGLHVADQPDWVTRRMVRPGVTGLAQLQTGSYEAPLAEKFKFDRIYVQHRMRAPAAERAGYDAAVLMATACKLVGKGRRDTAGRMCMGTPAPKLNPASGAQPG